MNRSASSRKQYRQFRAAGSPDPGAPAEWRDPQPKRKRKHERRYYLKQYWKWLKPFRRGLLVVFGLAVLTTLLNMGQPMLFAGIIDHSVLAEGLTDSEKLNRLSLLGGAVVALILIVQALDATRIYLMAILNAKFVHRLRQKLFDHLMVLPLGKLSERKQGGITSRLSGDIDNTSRILQMGLISPGVAILQVVMSLVIVFFWNWKLALAMTLCGPPLVAVMLFYVRRVRPIYRSMRKDREQVDGRVAEAFGGIRVVRAFRREAYERHDYAVGHHTVIRKQLLARLMETMLTSGWGLLVPTVALILVWYGGYLYLQGEATIGQIVAFQQYAFFMLGPVMRIIDSISMTQRGLAAMERIIDLMEEPPDKPDRPDAFNAPARVETIRFNNVHFEYEAGQPVIEDFDLEVPGGSLVALVGPSGAGKTTITDLVARFQDPTKGSITLNGTDLRKFKLGSYRQLLGTVEQDVFLFDGSVRENIAYGRRGATDAEIEAAARRANAHPFIAELPHGYDTIIGERGVKLSGGQRQRLSIARAVLADPQILVLDEATSNLDTESEQAIQGALKDLLRGRTTFVIAHRLSTITHADMIVVMDRGRIRELGTHEQLQKRNGLYTEMVDRQRRQFDIDDASLQFTR